MKVFTVKDAWRILSEKYQNDTIETASEIDNFFVFSTRPKNMPFGVGTGISCFFVDKETGKISMGSVIDPDVLNSKIERSFDPITLKER